jgi:pimeloyl-ACP methyl ester carboxylesterase
MQPLSGALTLRAFCTTPMRLIRHDWGGYIAIAAAAQRPEIARRIAVLCVPHMRAFTSLPLLQLFRSW